MGSPTTGTIPVPALPVLSATSCSAQSPKLARRREVMMVSLSRPARAASPMAAPSRRPGFEAAGRRQASLMATARSSNATRFTPTSAAGTNPKADSAE